MEGTKRCGGRMLYVFLLRQTERNEQADLAFVKLREFYRAFLDGFRSQVHKDNGERNASNGNLIGHRSRPLGSAISVDRVAKQMPGLNIINGTRALNITPDTLGIDEAQGLKRPSDNHDPFTNA